MKKGVLILAGAFAISLFSCKQNASDKVSDEKVEEAAARDAKAEDLPVMSFDEVEHDFGVITEGDVVEHTFAFTNTGKSPLVITNAKGSCGCTVPSYSKEAIAPGDKGEMLVKFNSKGKPNKQQKTVTISANTESGNEKIKIKAMVTPDPEKEKERAERKAKQAEAAAKKAAESGTGAVKEAASDAKNDLLGGKSHHSHKEAAVK